MSRIELDGLEDRIGVKCSKIKTEKNPAMQLTYFKDLLELADRSKEIAYSCCISIIKNRLGDALYNNLMKQI